MHVLMSMLITTHFLLPTGTHTHVRAVPGPEDEGGYAQDGRVPPLWV